MTLNSLLVPESHSHSIHRKCGTARGENIKQCIVCTGHGDMAISNAVGSNVFDILLCLGLPWFLQTTVGEARSGIEVYSAGMICYHGMGMEGVGADILSTNKGSTATLICLLQQGTISQNNALL